MSDFYKCYKCGESEFNHDVTEVYEEIFDSKEGKIIEDDRYFSTGVWQCKKCQAEIPEEDHQKFLLQMYDAYP